MHELNILNLWYKLLGITCRLDRIIGLMFYVQSILTTQQVFSISNNVYTVFLC